MKCDFDIVCTGLRMAWLQRMEVKQCPHNAEVCKHYLAEWALLSEVIGCLCMCLSVHVLLMCAHCVGVHLFVGWQPGLVCAELQHPLA